MKRLIRTVATAALASSLLAGGAAAGEGRGNGHGHGHGREWSAAQGRGERGEWGGRGDHGGRGGREDSRPGDGPVERGYPIRRRDGGPPQVYGYPGPPSYVRRLPPPGYGPRRGGLIPPQYRGAIVPDYGRHRLRPPPPGYAWVRMGDRYLLVSSSTGQIFDVIGR